jgi:hypothetical protein
MQVCDFSQIALKLITFEKSGLTINLKFRLFRKSELNL